MILRDSFKINGTLTILDVNDAVNNNLTALFYNGTNGLVEKRTIGNIINYNASSFLSSFNISVPNIFTTNISSVTPTNNSLTMMLASQSAGTVFAANPSFNGQPTFQHLTSSHLQNAGVMFTTHPANGITANNISNWNTSFGWGDFRVYGLGIRLDHNADANSARLRDNGFYTLGTNSTNRPTIITASYASAILTLSETSTRRFQISTGGNQERMFFRKNDDTVSGTWREFWHSGNFDPSTVLTTETDPIYTASIPNQMMFKSIIPDNSDLDTYTETGIYGQATSSRVATFLNCPTTKAMTLEVIKISSSMIFQRVTDHSTNKVYTRNFNSTWFAWKTLALTSDIVTYTAGNGLTLSGTQFSLPVTQSGSGSFVTSVVSSANGITVTKGDVPANSLVTSSSATGVTNVATTNTNTYLNIVRDGVSLGSSTQIQGAGATTITSDVSGKITVSSTNTTYSAGNGLTLSGTQFSLPVTVTGTGNVISDIITSTNGITVTKGLTAMLTSHPANGISLTDISNWNTSFNSLGNFVNVSGDTMTGRLIMNSDGGLNIPHGAVPTVLTNGDLWSTTSALFVRINGTSRQLAHTSSWSEITEAEVSAGTASTARFISGRRLQYAFNTLLAARASRLDPGATINGVLFDGSQNITVSASPLAHTHSISDIIGLQTALDGKQPLNSNLTSISSLTSGAGLLKRNANNTWTLDSSTYLTTETDPKGVSTLGISGTSSKTFTITLRDNTTVSSTLGALTVSELNTGTANDAKLISAITLKDYIDNRLSTTMNYKGQVTNYSNLPTTGNSIGDVYNIVNANSNPDIKAGDNVAWNGTGWDVLAGFVDLSNLVTNTQLLKLSGDVTANGNLTGTVGVTINNNAITSGKILDGAVVSSKLATILTTTGTFNNVLVNNKGLVVSGGNIAYLTSSDLSTELPNPTALTLRFNSGTVENSTQYVYNGSTAKTLDIVAGANINISASGSNKIVISGSNTMYTGNNPISINATTNVISHATGDGFNHIPTGGSANQWLKYSSAGTATWSALSALTFGSGFTTGSYTPNAAATININYGTVANTVAQGNDARFTSGTTAYNNSVTAVSISGTNTKTITLTRQGATALTATWTDIDTTYQSGSLQMLTTGTDLTYRVWNASDLSNFLVGQVAAGSPFESVTLGIQTRNWNSYAYSPNTLALGRSTYVAGNNSAVLGYALTVSDSESYALGSSSQVEGANSASIGSYNTVLKSKSSVFGLGLISRQEGYFAIGRFNRPTDAFDYIGDNEDRQEVFAVGSGLDEFSRRNALTIYQDNTTHFEGIPKYTNYKSLVDIRSLINSDDRALITKDYLSEYVANTAANIPAGTVAHITGNDSTQRSWGGNILKSWADNRLLYLSGGTISGNLTIFGRLTNMGEGNTISSNNSLSAMPAVGSNDHALKITNSNTSYGTLIGSLSSGNGYIQQGRTDGVPTNYLLTLNPYGGNVAIGNLSGSTNRMLIASAAGVINTMPLPTDTTYTAGSGLTLSGSQFSLPITVSGSGNYVQSVAQNANGLTVTLGTPPNTTYTAGNGLSLSGTQFSLPVTQSGTGNYVTSVVSSSTGITVTKGNVAWSDITGIPTLANEFSLRTNTNAYLTGAVTLTAGANVTLTQSGNVITISGTPNTTYSAASAAELISTTSTTARLITGQRLNEWAVNKGFISSFTEVDPKGVSSASVSGGTTKTLTITLNDNSIVQTSWVDTNDIYSLPLATNTIRGGVKVGAWNQIQVGVSGVIGVELSGEMACIKMTKDQVINLIGYTPASSDTTYSIASTSELNSSTSTTARLITGQRLNEWATNKGFISISEAPKLECEEKVIIAGNISGNSVILSVSSPIHRNSVMVFLNGVKLPKSKITISGTTITINNNTIFTPIVVGDLVEIEYLTA